MDCGFLERLKSGLVVQNWVGREVILGGSCNVSIGTFISHCGSNSLNSVGYLLDANLGLGKEC